MQSQKDFFEIRDFQVIIPGYEVETTVTKNEDKILELMSNEKISANIETQINSVNNIDEENSFLVGAIWEMKVKLWKINFKKQIKIKVKEILKIASEQS